ncbi:MAG: hypothetical protein WD278_12995, partial [Pirellulales bacterium]
DRLAVALDLTAPRILRYTRKGVTRGPLITMPGAMPRQVNLRTTDKPLREFVQGLGDFRETLELVLDGHVLAKLIPPTDLSEEEKQRILDEGWDLVKEARARNAGVPESEIAKTVDAAVRRVRSEE